MPIKICTVDTIVNNTKYCILDVQNLTKKIVIQNSLPYSSINLDCTVIRPPLLLL